MSRMVSLDMGITPQENWMFSAWREAMKALAGGELKRVRGNSNAAAGSNGIRPPRLEELP